jgi:RecG-like helicase
VAFLLALGCIEHPQLSNIVAFLSPTTLLAQQHVETLRTFVDGLDRHRCYFENGNGSVRSIHIEYLTGAITGVKRKQILDRITNCTKDEAVIVVGTHALISDEVTNTFSMIHRTKDDRISVVPGLALAIIDEEQRLGVEQRDSLIRYAAHTLYMSATPIPRTLALSKSTKKLSELTIGALDVSLLDEKPASAKNVTTSIVNINDVEKVIIGVQRQIAMGAKVFWIVPVIGNEEEGEDTENAIEGQLDHSMTVVKRFQQLSEYLGHEKVGMVHGRMASAERSRQLELFADRKSDMSIIVGTTVLEVGIDIPSVSILVVEEADRFGLSQLHQLRGRIGRASSLKEIIDHHEKILDCYCVLLTDVFSSDCKKEVARRRLDILRKSTDGKRIAEVDLMLRGPGEQLGERQAGLIGGGWSIDLRYHWDLELPASLLSRFFIKREQFFELSDSLNFDDLPAEIKLSNEFDILASFIGRTKSTEKIFHSPFASLLLRVYLCLFGRWNQAEWNTLRALETLRMIEVGRRYDDELEMMFINMADEIMGTKSLPSVLAPQDSSNEMAEQTEQKVCRSFA